MMDDLQALQREAMKRVTDIVEQVQNELAAAQEELLRKFFSDPDPEPVFVFRAQDGLAMAAIASYYSSCLMAGLKDHAAEVNKAMQDFRDWQRRNPDRMKMPDKEHVPLPRNMEATQRITPPIADDFPHGQRPEYCNWCPEPRNPWAEFHTTGAAHTVRTGPNSFAMNVPPVHSNPQNFYRSDNTICCTINHPCQKHAHFADPKQYEYPTRPIRDDPQA